MAPPKTEQPTLPGTRPDPQPAPPENPEPAPPPAQDAPAQAEKGNGEPADQRMARPGSQDLAKRKMDTVRTAFERLIPSMKAVLPKHITPERIIKIALVSCSKNPELLDCTPASMMGAIMQAAELGLDPGGALGHAYIVPFRNNNKPGRPKEATFIPGYRGLIALAKRSDEILSIEAHPVYKSDKLVVKFGRNPIFDHEPNLDLSPEQRKDSEIRGFYCLTRIRDNPEPQIEWLTKADVDHIRKKSKAADGPAWTNDYPEMGRKTAVKRGCKYLPLSPELATAIKVDDAHETGDLSEIEPFDFGEEVVETETTATSKTDALTQKLTGSASANA